MAAPDPPRDDAEIWMAALAGLVARLTANTDREGMLTTLASGIVEAFDMVFAGIWLYDPAGDAFHLRAAAGLHGNGADLRSRIETHELPAPLARAISGNRPVVIDGSDPENPLHRAAWMVERPPRTFAAIPLLVDGRLTGGMVVHRESPCPPPLTQALMILAQQAALMLEQSRLLDESRTLQSIAAELASARDSSVLMDGIVLRTRAVFGADGCAVWLLDNESGSLSAGAAHGLSTQFLRRIMARTTANITIAFAEVRRTGRPLYSPDAQKAARRNDPPLAEILAEEGVVSAILLPLYLPGGEIAGMVSLYHRRQRLYSDGEIALAQAFTDQVAVAMHNARLAEQEQAARIAAAARLERLTTITQITQELLTASDLNAVLDVVVDAALRLCQASSAMVGLIDGSGRLLTVDAFRGPVHRLAGMMDGGVALNEPDFPESVTGQALLSGRTAVAEDYNTWPPTAARTRTLASGVQAVIVAPLRIKQESIGVLWVNDSKPRAFSSDDVAMVEALADQAALAIEHARLMRRGQEAAVLEERARLARELHDSVTQSVFSLGMLVRAAEAQHARGLPSLGGTLGRIGRLAQETLTEMRALLFELRPAALEEAGLAVALERLVAASRLRGDLPVTYTAGQGAGLRLSPEVETAVFRIVQEALTNAAKHARATSVTIELVVRDDRLVASVTDDGAGFDLSVADGPDSRSPLDRSRGPGEASDFGRERGAGGLGMRSMRERANGAGVTLDITSAPGAGTTVTVEAPLS